MKNLVSSIVVVGLTLALGGCVVRSRAPVYVAPRPAVYVAPRPVYVQPQPVYVQPPIVQGTVIVR